MQNPSFLAILLPILLSACLPSQDFTPEEVIQPTVAYTAIPTLTALPPSPTYAVSPLDDADHIVYYFAPNLCEATWTNNGAEFPCPGMQGQTSGYVSLLTEVELKLPYQANAILSVPSQDGRLLGVFGAFPRMQIDLADFFRAQLYCLPETPCDVTFSLAYYDFNNKFYEPFPDWPYHYQDPPKLINLSLSKLAGQTVQLMLIVRDNGDPTGDFAVWVEPRITRHPGISTPIP